MNAPIDICDQCPFCGAPTSDLEAFKIIQHRETRVRYRAHEICHRMAQLKNREVGVSLTEQRLEELKESWDVSVQSELTCFPRWSYARTSNAEFMGRVSQTLARGIAAWSGLTSLFVSSKTGDGKTALLVAKQHDRYAQCEKEITTLGERRTMNFAFVSGPRVAGCRRRCKIGDEAPFVELAIETPLLFLDELGYEPLSEELLFIVDERHKSGRPTVTTTGRTLEDFVARYGGSLFRKLTEGGTIVEGWE